VALHSADLGCVAMVIGDLVEWDGYLGMITSFDKDGDIFLYIFDKQYKMLVFKSECTAHCR
jgi:hypothetical protein|tara:strand:- start:1045 stop:1227 length:183 start_codon:yes stop_codon:yes gene_type:complete